MQDCDELIILTLSRSNVILLVESLQLLDHCSVLPTHLQPTLEALVGATVQPTSSRSITPFDDSLGHSTVSVIPISPFDSLVQNLATSDPFLNDKQHPNAVTTAQVASKCPLRRVASTILQIRCRYFPSRQQPHFKRLIIRSPYILARHSAATIRSHVSNAAPPQTVITHFGLGLEDEGSNIPGDSTSHLHCYPTYRALRCANQPPGFQELLPLTDNEISAAIPTKESWKRPYALRNDSSSSQVGAILARLAAASWDSTTHDVKGWVTSVAKSLGYERASSQDHDLRSIVFRCTRLRTKNVSLNFLWMMALIQVVSKCQSIRIRTGMSSLSKIWRQELKDMPHQPELRTLKYWYALGSKYALLAGGGSVYLLILIAGIGLRTSIGKLSSHVLWQLANALRSPVQAGHRRSVEKSILPTITRMKTILPISMDTLFAALLPGEYQLPGSVDCHNLSQSDGFSDAMVANSFNLLPRDTSIW
ncbi:hypothetical protein L210DRAFT_3765778 [Boletus edulis BED1]|uniref:Uncharacterized protein n=1 Tax=Boletus edulis BED1 TaxID=1328754 RepID=A0AAD4G6S1_BOLED|nr:hypothetical protein L210DRAFT_3766525 [Boletus edulis BED1]KAF8423440.1 hypothetical protein L210DRAFT_3765778 [Boletus edulis BED1]